MTVKMKDVHPWHREWPSFVVQPGDAGRVLEQDGDQVLVWWAKYGHASWCKLDILEVIE